KGDPPVPVGRRSDLSRERLRRSLRQQAGGRGSTPRWRFPSPVHVRDVPVRRPLASPPFGTFVSCANGCNGYEMDPVTSLSSRPTRAEAKLLGPRVTQDFLDKLAGRVAASGRAEPIPVEMPATGEVLGVVPHSTTEDLAAAAEA